MSVQQDTPVIPASTTVAPTSRTWLRRISSGGQIVETCPPFCTDTHVNDQRATSLDDLQHGATMPGLDVAVDDATGGTKPLHILAPRLAVDPYSTDPARRIPHILLEVTPDEYTLPLSPAGLVAVIAEQRAHLDRLERVALGQLVAARADAGVV